MRESYRQRAGISRNKERGALRNAPPKHAIEKAHALTSSFAGGAGAMSYCVRL